MTTNNNNDMSAQRLREQAYEVLQLEQALMDQLDSLPFRIKEAKEAAVSRYNVQRAEVMEGRSDTLPAVDLSEVEAIEQTEPELKRRAKEYGIDRFELEARAYRMEEAEHRATVESLDESLAELEREKARIDKELEEIRWARHAANSKREDATKQRLLFERAAAFHRQSDDVQRRMG